MEISMDISMDTFSTKLSLEKQVFVGAFPCDEDQIKQFPEIVSQNIQGDRWKLSKTICLLLGLESVQHFML